MLLCILREFRGYILFLSAKIRVNLRQKIFREFRVFCGEKIHIERGAHGVLTKNKNYAKNFISRFYKHLPQKIPCGRTPIFARCAHFRAIYRGTVYFRGMGVSPMFLSVSPAIYSRG
jgi:hypothetical protein